MCSCCCVNLCTARNLLRYQYRIRGNDLVEECAIPYGLKCIGDMFGGVFPPVWCFLYGFFVAGSMQLLQEVQARQRGGTPRPIGQEGRYLAGYDHAGALGGASDAVAVFSPFAARAPYVMAAAPHNGYARVYQSGVQPYELRNVSVSGGVVVGTPVKSQEQTVVTV